MTTTAITPHRARRRPPHARRGTSWPTASTSSSTTRRATAPGCSTRAAGREYLDFLTFFGSNPIGYNHPRMKDPEFLQVLHRVAQLKPSLSDLYSVEYAQFVDTLGRLAMPDAHEVRRSSSRAARWGSRTR